MTNSDSSTLNLPRTWTIFTGLFVALTLFLGVIFVMHFYVDYQTEVTQRDSAEVLNIGLARRALVEEISAVTTDLMFLSGLFERINYHSQQQDVLLYMTEVFITFAREKGIYDQIRFLNLRGREEIRVNFKNGQPELVASEQLQDKSSRYYVDQALKLDENQVYLSPLDLNVEGGEIEVPQKPVLRFASPVYDSENHLQGLIVLNYLGKRLLGRFREVSVNIEDHIQLLNASGYWLSSPQAGQAWGFMYGRADTFQRQFSDAWKIINRQSRGQFVNQHGLFTFDTVLPRLEASRVIPSVNIADRQEQVWKVVSYVPADQDVLSIGNFISRHARLYLGILILMAILTYLVANSHVHRRRAEAQQAYEQKFRQTLEDIELVALMINLRGELVFCNHYLLNLTGWRYHEIMNKDWVNSLIPAEQQTRLRILLANLGKDEDFPHEIEMEVNTKAGEQRLISWKNTLSRNENGTVTGVTAIGEDITDTRQAEEQVRILTTAMQQSPASIVITNRNGLIEYVNPKFTQVTGYSAAEITGKNPRILKSGETPAEEYSQLWEALEAGGEWRGEFHNRRKDGELYWESAVISALRDMDGEITHFLAVKEDITERKRLQQEVDTRNLELSRAHALTAMGRMASMLAHDLSNPLSSVKMAVQILGKQATTTEGRELADISQEQVSYMEVIITEMLTYARPGELESSWLDTEKLLNGVISTAQRRIVEMAADVQLNCQPGLPTFPGDASKLRQLFSNLLVNALQATGVKQQGERHVQLTAERVMTAGGHQLQFRICDNGAGIDPAIKDRLFEPFFTTRARGTGLGLAIVRQIVDLHGGEIELADNLPGGTCVTVNLPLTPAVSTRKQSHIRVNNKRETV